MVQSKNKRIYKLARIYSIKIKLFVKVKGNYISEGDSNQTKLNKTIISRICESWSQTDFIIVCMAVQTTTVYQKFI